MSRRLSILLPNGRRFHTSEELTVSAVKSRAAEILLLSVEDARLFGLAEIDASGQYHWIKEDQRLSENDVLHYKIRFFVDSVLSLTSPSAFEAFFLSAYDSFLKEELELSSTAWKQMMSYLLQIFGEDTEREDAELILRHIIPEPLRLTDEITITEILDLHSKLKGLSRGTAMIRFLQLAEKSSYYGCYFYNVRRFDGQKCLLGVCSAGIVVSQSDRHHKMFPWKQLDNLYYKEDKFIIEIHRSTARESLEEVKDPELLKAVCDPTTQVSSVQRRHVRLQTFICKEVALSKTIWQVAITQHQFFLDQKHRRPRNNIDHTEKIGRLISSSSLCSSLPSLSSLHVASSTMPAAKVGDGSSATSLPTVKGRTEEEKSFARERYAKLKSRRFKLENDLRDKMKELFAVCLKEAETTGEIPEEMRKALFPGQEVPKLQKRIGTSFSIPEELIRGDRANRLIQLETDVELHKKIVAAAERLAKDKNTNKSVRKKRQKDLQAATLKLKGLEVGLSQLRLSASKPDVSSIGTTRSEVSWSGATAKSCPTTPHGSIPDLLQQSREDGIDGFIARRAPSENSRQSLAQRFSEASSSSSSLGLPPTGQRRSFTQHSTKSDELDNPLASPIYENVGYRSTCYRSSYRQAHYPTIQDEQSRRRSASAHSVARETVPRVVREVAIVAPRRIPAVIPASVSCSGGFATASLDRRETRSQQVHKTHMSQSGSFLSNNRITTFPVSQTNSHFENPLPRFQQPPLTHFPHRGALPAYTLGQSASSGRLQTGTDPHMEALLQYYKTEARKGPQQTATIV